MISAPTIVFSLKCLSSVGTELCLSRMRRAAGPSQDIGFVAAQEVTFQATSWPALAVICWMSIDCVFHYLI